MPQSVDKIIENAQEKGYAPLSYPAGGLIRGKCPQCNTIGSALIFRHQTDESLVDIYACQCGYRQFGY